MMEQKEHYVLVIEHTDKAKSVIKTLLPHLPYPKQKKMSGSAVKKRINREMQKAFPNQDLTREN